MNLSSLASFLRIAALFVCAPVLLTSRPAVAVHSFEPGAGSAREASDSVSVLPSTLSAENHLMSSIPAAFAGANVGGMLGANTFYANGINGQNAVVANIEAGHIWNGHESLGHVSSYVHHSDTWGGGTADLYDRHATWVGMMIGGRHAAPPGDYQTGIAPGADLRSGAVASSWTGSAYATNFNVTADSMVTPFVSYFGSVDVINSSFGFVDSSGGSAFTVAFDGMANANPRTTFVVSAGNAGPATNTVASPGSGYNAITVGALQNDGTNNYASVASFSSRGPQTYSDPLNGTFSNARAPIDIAAPGTHLTTAYYGGQSGGNNTSLTGSPSGSTGGPNFYSTSVQGTSFSAPIVAGAAALLDSASYNTPQLAANAASRDARVVKAVLLNSASKIPGWTNGQTAHGNGNGGVLTSQSLDYRTGAGALNLDRAYDQYLEGMTTDVVGTLPGFQGLVDEVGWDFGIVQSGLDNSYLIAQPLIAGTSLTITLDWFRNRALNLSTLQVADIGQVDLDLIVRDFNTGDVISESISAFNVVEHLHFPVPRTSLYQIEVNFYGALFGGITSEEYGLAWFGTALPEPSTAIMLVLAMCVLPIRRRGSTVKML